MLNFIRKRINVVKNFSETSKMLCGNRKIIDFLLTKYILGVPIEEYLNLGFYNKPWNVRKQYLYNDDPLFRIYNPDVNFDSEDDKIDLYYKTKDFMRRKIITNKNLSLEDFKKFTEGLCSFFYKPADSYGGKGIQKIYLDKDIDLLELYNEIIKLPEGLLEETVIQHEMLNHLCPNLLQTIRFGVFKHKDGPKILFATLKTSMSKDAFVDNATSGGIFANINLETGRIQTNAYRFLNFNTQEDVEQFGIKVFDEEGLAVHPITGVVFKGFEIPYFEEAKKLVLDISSQNDFYNRRLLGIDIAISEKGPDLIEVNTTRPGMTHLWQVACKSMPVKPVLDKMLKE